MSYKEARLMKTLLGSSYIKISNREDQRVLQFCRYASTNCEFEEVEEYEFSSSLEFNFVRKVNDSEIIIFVSEEDERRFLEFLSIF